MEVNQVGWLTRGTIIADRSTQKLLLRGKMPGQDYDYEDDTDTRVPATTSYCDGSWYGSEEMMNPRSINLSSIWKTAETVSSLDADSLYEMCISEEDTLRLLKDLDVCYQCQVARDESSSTQCIQPYSLVLVARTYLNYLQGIFEPQYILPKITCSQLQSRWTDAIQSQLTDILTGCTKYTLEMTKLKQLEDGEYSSCPIPINPLTLVDKDFLQTDIVRFTSSVYATKNDKKSARTMYNAESSGQLSVSRPQDSSFEGSFYELGVNSMYSTGEQGFYEMYLNDVLPKEAAIALAAVIVTSLCILMHTKSLFLTLLGLMQITLALPVAYSMYYFICGLSFFPFVNVNALFIVFALGADGECH